MGRMLPFPIVLQFEIVIVAQANSYMERGLSNRNCSTVHAPSRKHASVFRGLQRKADPDSIIYVSTRMSR